MPWRAHWAWGKQMVVSDNWLDGAYAYRGRNFQRRLEKLVVMDAFLPGWAEWEAVYNNPAIWHFASTGATPEATGARTRALFRTLLETTSRPTKNARFQKRPESVQPRHMRDREG